MHSTIKVEKPDNVAVTLTITASLSEWKTIKENIEGHSIPCVAFRSIIYDAVSKISDQIAINKE